MAGTIKIGCTLPHGIILHHNDVTVEIAGANQQTSEYFKLLGDFGITDVDADFWAAWKKANWAFTAYISGAIYEANDEKSAKAKGKEQATIDTGFKPLDPSSHGVIEDTGE